MSSSYKGLYHGIKLSGSCLLLSLALLLAGTALVPDCARAADTVVLEPGQDYSGRYDSALPVTYEFTLEEEAIVSLKGYQFPNLAYFLELYSKVDSNNGQPAAMPLKAVTMLDFSGDIQTLDMANFSLNVSDYAAEDGEAFFSLSAGTYYLRVVPHSHNTGFDYKFALDIQPFIYETDGEPNNELASSSEYKTGSWQEGRVVVNGLNPDSSRQDWYRVTVPEAGSYRFDYASDGFFRGNFTWYNQQGKDVVLNASNSESESASRKTVLDALDSPYSASLGEHAESAADYQALLDFPKAGEYYLCVNGVDAGSYKFCLSPVAATLAADQASTNETVADSALSDDSNNSSAAPPTTSGSQEVELIFLLDQAFYNSNGAVVTMDSVPYSYNNRVFLPIRALANGIGIPDSGIIWNSVDRTVTLTDGVTTLSMVLDSPVLYINGTAQTMDVSPASSANRVFLPARYIVEAYGLTAEWEPVSGSVIIRGAKTGQSQSSTPDPVSNSQSSVGTIELDRQMIGDELRKGSYNGSLVDGQPNGNGTWVDCLGRIKTGSFSMSSATDIAIKNAHVAFPDGAEFTGAYSAVLYTAIEKFEGHFVFPNNGNVFDGVVENTADLQQHMVGTYTLPNGNTVDVDRFYDLSGGN